MNLEHLPLADVAISILSIAASPDLTLSGIDLDSGRSVKIQITSDALGELTSQLQPSSPGLVLILTLYADVPSDAD